MGPIDRRLGAALLAAVVSVGCSSDDGGGSGSQAGAGCPTDGSSYNSDYQALECGVLALVNQRRAEGAVCGGESMPAVPAVSMNAALRSAARDHAGDMARNNYFSHDSQDGREPWDRMEAAGYEYRAAGENIAAGSGTAAAVMDQWMTSPGHCKNIMSGSFTEIGIGYSFHAESDYRHYWVQNFGAPR